MTYKWDLNLKIRLFGDTLFNFFYWMYFPFLAIYFSQLVGTTLAAFFMMLAPIISLVTGLVSGYFADVIGRRKLMLLSTITLTWMFLLFLIVDNIWLQYLAFIGITIGTAIYRPASDAMVADIVPVENRKQVFAIFTSFNNIGAVLGPIIGATLFFEHRDILLIGCTLVSAIYFVLIFVRLHETMPSSQSIPPRFSLVSTFVGYFDILKEKTFALYIVAGVFSFIVFLQLDLYLAVYLSNEVPPQTILNGIVLADKEIFGWLLGVNGLLFVLLIVPLTNLLKTWSDRNVFMTSCLLGGFGLFGLVLFDNFWLLLMMVTVFTIGEIIRGPVSFNFVSSYAPEQKRAQYMAAANLQFTIGRFFAPLTLSLSAFVEPIVVFSIILACALLSMGLYFILYKRETAN